MKRFFAVLFFLPVLLGAGSPPETEEIYRLFEAQHLPEQITYIIRSVVMRQLEQSPEMKQYEPTVAAFLEKSIGYPALREELAGIYRKHFTAEEIRCMTEFYLSPAGKKMAAQSAGIFQETSLLIEAKLRGSLSQLSEQMQRIRSAAPQGLTSDRKAGDSGNP